MKKRRLFSFDSRLHLVTGVEKVLLNIHYAVRFDYESKIVGFKSYRHINRNLNISSDEYCQWKNPFMFYNSIVILHERKFLLLFWILNHVLFQRIKLIYVHHNELYGHRMMTIMPRTVVAISDNGIRNLMGYFRVSRSRIHKIYNCVEDRNIKRTCSFRSDQLIKILYSARINDVKRQIEIVKQLKGKLNKNVQILFAGIGPRYEEFRQKVKNDEQFVSLGFVENIPQLMKECDYVMLFSTHEGLPITLIEATMMGTPIICNDVGGNTEICHNEKNGIVVNDWEDLLATLNGLSQMNEERYRSLCQHAREIYENHFTFERFKRNYLSLLNTLQV